MHIMKRYKYTALYLLAVLFLILAVNVARAEATPTHQGKVCRPAEAKVYKAHLVVGASTSCALGRVVERKIIRYRSTRILRVMRVKSPVTHRVYTLYATSQTRDGDWTYESRKDEDLWVRLWY